MRKKKAITIIAGEETYQNLSTFSDIEELNKAVRHYKEKFKDKLTKSALAVLGQLHRFSAKYIGCSFRSKGNIAETLNISRRTVIRACQVLEDLGIIKQYEMKRSKDMQQTSNAIVIQPVVTQDKPKTEEECHTKTKPNSKTNNNKDIRNQSVPVNHFPNEFLKQASFYFPEDQCRELNKIRLIHTRINKLSSESSIRASVGALKITISKVKCGKVKRIMGYFDGVIRKIFKQQRVNSMFINVFEQ